MNSPRTKPQLVPSGTNSRKKQADLENDEAFKWLKLRWKQSADRVGRAEAVGEFFEQRPNLSRAAVGACLGVTGGTLKRDLRIAALMAADKDLIRRGRSITDVLKDARKNEEKQRERQRRRLGLDKNNQIDCLFEQLVKWGESIGLWPNVVAQIFDEAGNELPAWCRKLRPNSRPIRWPVERAISLGRTRAEAYGRRHPYPFHIYFYMYWVLWWARALYPNQQVLETAFEKAWRYFDSKPRYQVNPPSAREISEDFRRRQAEERANREQALRDLRHSKPWTYQT